MRRLLMLTILATLAAGCRTTPAPQPCCRPAYSSCNPCNTCGTTTMATPTMSGPMVETYGAPGAPTFQSGPTVVTPGPNTYVPTTPN
ncbi:MAG TPA: hypothetical protein VHY91_03390 [Pirellulales bacterium]|jgi:hypothetical protein|nr:hypothetical protein [Pirellulales bacterium]